MTKIRERESLHLGLLIVVTRCCDDEINEGVVRVAPINCQRSDARARDHREGEKGLAYDVTKRLKTTDPVANALEPTVGSHCVE
ncbi:MAG TPA: hypothetical protein PKA58_00010 [Polyangium sp.]|nr:hypothetical protein [Polyangium sp.]